MINTSISYFSINDQNSNFCKLFENAYFEKYFLLKLKNFGQSFNLDSSPNKTKVFSGIMLFAAKKNEFGIGWLGNDLEGFFEVNCRFIII
jgi:hypothetical protein